MNIFINLVKTLMTIVVISGVVACGDLTKITEDDYSGHKLKNAPVDLIKSGKSTKADVYSILGRPSSTGGFGNNTWYYVSEHRTQTAFLDAKPKQRDVVTIVFNDKDIVKDINNKNLEDGADIPISKKKIPAKGVEKSVLEELFGGVGLKPIPVTE